MDCKFISNFLFFVIFRDTPSPPLVERRSRGGLRPALSLAQLCDLDDEKTAPSSIRLIAQWENLIQKKQEVA